jgi:hypothetical protein
MNNSLIFNYDKDKNITVAGYEINSDMLNANRSPISTLNFSKSAKDIKSIADIFKGKIVPAGLFSGEQMNYSDNKDKDVLDDLKDLIENPNITLDKFAKKHSKTKKHLSKKKKQKTKRNK